MSHATIVPRTIRVLLSFTDAAALVKLRKLE